MFNRAVAAAPQLSSVVGKSCNAADREAAIKIRHGAWGGFLFSCAASVSGSMPRCTPPFSLGCPRAHKTGHHAVLCQLLPPGLLPGIAVPLTSPFILSVFLFGTWLACILLAPRSCASFVRDLSPGPKERDTGRSEHLLMPRLYSQC